MKKKSLTELAKDGQQFLFGELGLDTQTLALFGKIVGLRNDRRVRTVEAAAHGFIEQEESQPKHYEYTTKVRLVDPISVDEINDLLRENGLHSASCLQEIHRYNAVYRYEVGKSFCWLSFHNIKSEGEQ